MALRGKGCAVGGACIAQPAGVRRRCVGEQKCLGGRVAVRGREEAFGGEWVVRSAGLTHIRRSSTRARVLLYIRPACPRREIAAMGSKDAPCEHPSPANDFRTRPVRVCTSAPAFTLPPSAFTLPPHSLPLPPRSNRPSAAAVIHNGLSTEKLSTSLLAALCKTFSPSRLRTRIYNISFARRLLPGVSAPLWGRGHAVVTPCPAPPSAGWGRAKAKVDAPSRSAEPCRLCAESLCAKAEVHKANPAPARALSPRQLVYRRAPARLCAEPCRLCVESLCAKAECTRPTPPPPVRSPRGNLSTAAPPPADGRSAVRRVGEGEGKGGRPLAQCRTMPLECRVMPLVCRITVRKGGSAQGQPRPCPCTLPAATCLRPCPRPLMGVAPCVLPAATCLPPRPRRLNGSPATVGGRENDRMAHRRTATPTHRTQRGNDTCTIRVP